MLEQRKATETPRSSAVPVICVTRTTCFLYKRFPSQWDLKYNSQLQQLDITSIGLLAQLLLVKSKFKQTTESHANSKMLSSCGHRCGKGNKANNNAENIEDVI